MTAVQPLARFGALEFCSNGIIKEFIEKPKNSDSWINGGFFVLSEKVTDYVKSNNESWENGAVDRLVKIKKFVLLNIMVFGNQWIH